MAEVVEIRLKATDGTVSVFRASGAAAQAMGKQVEQAGKGGARALGELDRAADRSGKTWAEAGQKIGLALGAVSGLAIKAANESEAVQTRLRQSVENTGESYDELAGRIQAMGETSLSLAFDDEDAAAALANLTDATGSATDALENMGLVMDIARARGISLADSAKIVAAVEQERYGSLARLGIQIDETATREEALGQIQAKYAGQAEAYATTNAAAYERFGNSVENSLESLGAHLTDLQGPLMALGAGSQLLGPLSSGIRDLGQSAKVAQLGTAALTLATGPVGLAAAGIAATSALVYLVATTDEYSASAQSAEEETADLANSYAALAASIDDVVERERVRQTYASFSGFQEQAQKDLATFEQLGEAITDLQLEGVTDAAVGGLIESLSEADQVWIDSNFGNGNARLSIEELTLAQAAYGDKLQITAAQADQVSSSMTDLFSHSDIDITAADAAVNELIASWARGEITGGELATRVTELSANWSQFSDYALDAATATDGMTGAVDRLNAAEIRQLETSQASQNRMRELAGSAGNYGNTLDKLTGATVAESLAVQGSINQRQVAIATLDRETAAMEKAKAQADALVSAYEAITGRDVDLTGLAGPQTVELNVALNTEDAVRSLETTFRVAVQNTNSTAGLVDNVLKWGEELVGVEGVYGRIDDLVASGAISTERHGMAQRAYNRMVEDGAGIQEDILAIQAKQAPYIANDVRNLERQYTLIADMAPAAARVALGFMDGSQSAAAMAFHTQLMADAQGGLLDDNAAFWNATIDGLETANPGLLAMLETTGQVKKTLDEAGNWDGVSYEVNLEGAEEAKSALEGITTALEALVNYEEIRVGIDLDGDGDIGLAKQAVDELDGREAKVKITTDAAAVDEMLRWGGVGSDGLKLPVTPVISHAEAPEFEPIDWPVNLKVESDTGSDRAAVLEMLGWGSVEPIVQPVDVDATGAEAGISDVTAQINAWGGITATATADATTVPANIAIAAAAQRVETFGDLYALARIDADNSGAETAIGNTWSSLAAVGGASATPSIYANDNATGVLNNVGGLLAGLDGRTATTYVNTVYSSVRTGPSGGEPEKYATGGVVIRGGEVGPEVMTTPSGMRAILPRDGLYTVPEGSYVSPTVATRGGGGGGGGITITGPVYVVASTPDIHDALNGQLLAQGRR